MSDNIILEHLKAIRHQLDGHGERLTRIEVRHGSIEQHLGLTVASGAGDRTAVPLLARCIKRIETRLSMSDS